MIVPKINDITQEPFIRYHLEKKEDTFSVKINPEERAIIQHAKKILRQPKDSTVLKQLAKIGYKSITRPEIEEIINILFNNDRKNTRLGIPETEFEIDKSKS